MQNGKVQYLKGLGCIFVLLFCTEISSQNINDIPLDSIDHWIVFGTEDGLGLEDSIKYWIKQSENSNDCKLSLRLLRKLGKLYGNNNQYSRAYQLYDSVAVKISDCHELPYSEKLEFNNVTNDMLSRIGQGHSSYIGSKALQKQYEHLISKNDALESDSLAFAMSLLNTGKYDSSIGNFSEAKLQIEKSKIILAKYPDYNLQLGEALTVLGVIEDKLENYEQSVSYLNEAITTYNNEKIYTNYIDYYIPFTYFQMSESKLKLRDFDNAEKYLIQAQDSDINNYYQISFLDIKSRIEREKGEFQKSLDNHRTLLEIFKNKQAEINMLTIKQRISEVYFNLNKSYKADSLYKDVIDSLLDRSNSKFEIDSIQLIPNQQKNQILINCCMGLSKSCLHSVKNKTDVLKAIQYVKKTDDLFTQYLEGMDDVASKYLMVQDFSDYYRNFTKSILRLAEKFQSEELESLSYYFAAKNKAIILRQNQDQNLSINKHLSPQEKEKIIATKKRYYLLKHEFDNTEFSNEEQKAKVIDQLVSYQNDYKGLIDEFEIKYQNYSFIRNLSAPLEIKEIQEALSPNEAIVEYYFTDSMLISFLITRDQFDSSLNNENVKQSFGDSIEDNQSMDFSFLMEPWMPFLIENKISKISVVPDGWIWKVPFEAIEYQNEYLLNLFDISYAFSSQLVVLRTDPNNEPQTSNALAMGTSYDREGLNIIQDKYLKKYDLDANLTTLSFVQNELSSLRELLKFETVENEECSLEYFLNNVEKYNLVHLSLHGVADQKSNRNALLFNPNHADEKFYLSFDELYGMNLNTDLVVLSACQTNVGKIDQGEGIRSMARSFVHAGSRSLIGSLWNASDKATFKILIQFYKYLKKGKTKDHALRLAKLDYLEKAPPSQKSPKYWANIILIGDVSPMNFEQSAFGSVGLMILVVIIVLVILMLMRKFK